MIKPIFKQLLFKRDKEWIDTIQHSGFGFFVPGVNSGIYDPATLVVQARIEEKWAGFFKFKTVKSFAEITLTPNEFDELFSEMEKIKKLREAKLTN
jgi:hypothetical protein